MTKLIEGGFLGAGKRFAIVASRFNDLFADRLVDGAVDTLVRHGVSDGDITVVRCPGAFEIPQVAQRVANTDHFDGVICIGVVIRGSTPHFDFICAEATKGVGAIAMSSKAAITYGIITCDTLDQAMERSGSKAGNKGCEAAMAALEMANLLKAVDGMA